MAREHQALEERHLRIEVLAKATSHTVTTITALCAAVGGDIGIVERLIGLPSALDIWQRVELWKRGESARAGLGEVAVRLSLKWHHAQTRAQSRRVSSGVKPTPEASVHLWLAERIPTLLRMRDLGYFERHAIRDQ